MTPHQLETYKSMIAISIEAIKFSALANGGAAVALLAYLGNVHGKAPGQPVVDLGYAMSLFALGLLFSGFLIAASYLTQLRLYNEAPTSPAPQRRAGHRRFLYAAIACFLFSLMSFGAGAIAAVMAWSAPAVVAPVSTPQ